MEVKQFQESLIINDHKDVVLIQKLAMKQDDKNRQSYNCSFYEWELSHHRMDVIQTHKCLQEQLSTPLYETILDDMTANKSFRNRLKQR